MNKPSVSVIIAAYNCEHFIQPCIDSVLQEKSSDYEIIVINDGSTDLTLQQLEQYQNHRKIIIHSLTKNVGAAKARNIGVEKSQGNYLLFLDSDTKIPAGWSKNIKAFFEKHRNAAAAQVKLLKYETKHFDYAGDLTTPFCFLSDRGRGARDSGQFDDDVIFSGKSAGMLVRRDIFEKVSGFDEGYHIFYEDTDLCWRIWLAGYEVRFLPQVTVHHHYVAENKSTAYYAHLQVIYKGCKNTITSLIKNLETKNLFFKLPIHAFIWFILAILMVFKGKFRESREIMQGIIWNVFNFHHILKKRKSTQINRNISDDELFNKVGTNQTIEYYIGKAVAYIKGKPY